MSAFIVDDGTIDRVIDAIFLHRENMTCEHGAFNIADEVPAKWDELGVRLLRMNHRATRQRYGDPEPLHIEYRYPLRFLQTTKVQALKATRCLLYQCSEGNVPDEPLFKELERFSDCQAHWIVSDLPEYSEAAWDSYRELA
jgi:hypothetical protein